MDSVECIKDDVPSDRVKTVNDSKRLHKRNILFMENEVDYTFDVGVFKRQ